MSDAAAAAIDLPRPHSAAAPGAHDAHAAHGAAHESGPAVSQAKFAVWLFLASEVMFFTGLIGAFLVLKASARPFEADGAWQTVFSLPQRHLDKWVALGNTFVLLASGFTMLSAVAAVRLGDAGKLRLHLALTCVLGLVFIGIKGFEYHQKIEHGFLPWTNTFFGMYFALTGLHVLHMLGGIVPMAVILLRLQFGIRPREQTVELFGLYWSFVDIVWIFLFPLLYLMP